MGEQLTAADLFCGAGGASLGAEAAGFDLVAAVDTDTDALDTHADNCGGYTVAHDLSVIDTDIIPEVDVDYLHGSPPCKGFSNANDARAIDDERNSLVFDFIDWVAALDPKVVSMENVTGMLSISDHFIEHVTAAFRDIGFTAKYRTLNAADFGVPQTRKRVFTIAVRDDIDADGRWFPQPTHAEAATTTLDGRELSEWLTVEDAIGELTIDDSRNRDFELTDPINEPHQKAGRRPMGKRHEPANVIRAGTAPLKLIKNHETMNSDRQKLAQIEPGTAPGAAMSRVAADEPSNTIVAGKAAPPAHYRTEPIPNHEPRPATADPPQGWETDRPSTAISEPRLDPPNEHKPDGDNRRFMGARRLTVRECARLQSFPDWFEFHGTKTAQYQQVGNAVPPLLQYHVASQLATFTQEESANE